MPAPLRPRLSSAGKWITATVSTAAALMSIFSVARTYGMVGEAGPSQLAIGALGASWVGLSPASATATSIGDTIHLAATVTNKSGSVLVGSWLQWSSEDTTVATVSPSGTVIARAPGSTTIILLVGNLIARSRIAVKPEPFDVRFIPDSGITISEGSHARVRPHVVDARGSPIAGATPMLRVADTSIATADTSGVILANAAGETTLEATANGITARTSIRVKAVPSSIAGVSGIDQHASAGRPLASPVVVRVLSLRGRPIAGVPVYFATADGQGRADPETVMTDSAGRGRTTWTLGEIPGPQRLLARTERLDSAATILAEADPVAANVRHVLIGDAQVGAAGDTLPLPVGVRVTDSTGRALIDIPVAWTATGADSLVPLNARTDSLGEAHVRWTLGPSAGVHRARVQIGATRAVPAYPLTALARPGTVKAVVVQRGQGQRGTAGSTLPQAIVLRIADRFDNPVAGATVTFVPSHGSTRDSVLATDSAGRVSTRWTLGAPPGQQKLVARVSGVTKPVEITATVTVGRASNVAFVSPAATGVTGKPLPAPLTVVITDGQGNAIAGAAVSFASASGTVTPPKATTDAKGRASTRWTLGGKSGTQTLTASVKGTSARATLEVQAGKTAVAPTVAPLAKAAVSKPAATKPATKPVVAKPTGKKPPR